jgi:outer membrane protein assembly factor BamB
MCAAATAGLPHRNHPALPRVTGTMSSQAVARSAPRPLRLWPGIAIAVTVLLARYVAPVLVPRVPEVTFIGMMVSAVGVLLFLVWWLFLSRASWKERLAAVVLLAGALYATSWIVHPSIGTGAMGVLFYILAVPVVTIAFVAGTVAGRGRPDGTRRLMAAAAVLAACAGLALLRTGGFDGSFDHDFAWRWTPTAEERLLAADPGIGPASAPAPTPIAPPAAAAATPAATPPAAASASPAPAPTVTTGAAAPPAAAATPAAVAGASGAGAPAAVAPTPVVPPPAEWPGFRGRQRNGVARADRIATDWAASPPTALWQRPIGPGWSSFAVAGDLVYTQEQRGDDEVVACYRLSTGEPVWMHRDRTRFWESNAGAGPRATPLIQGGRIYTLGAKGTLNALDARSGAVAWSRNAATDTAAELPMWGFSGSPVVTGDTLIVAASGALAGYDLGTGRLRWKNAAQGGEGYSSPQLATLDGVPQVLLVNSVGVSSVAPADGKLLWSHAWKGFPMVQPALTTDGDVLVAANDSDGVRRLVVRRGATGWSATERWTSKGLKPYFNDFVVHGGYAYGFDGAILSCIDLADGARKWKGGRYGNGQMVLLPDQDALLVLSEEGEIALVRATPDGYAELGKIAGLDGKTWNHPVIVGNILLVRNGEQMAAFRLPAANRLSSAAQP